MRTGLFTRIRLFLIVILSVVNIYFGGHWIYSRYIFDYRDTAWKEVSSSFSSNWVFAMDKIEEKTDNTKWMRVVKHKIKEGMRKKISEFSYIFGTGRRSSEEIRQAAEARKRMAKEKEEKETPPPAPTNETEEKKEEDENKDKQELLARAKKMELGPRASELYAGSETTEVMERLRQKDLDFYSLWLLYSFSANLALIISLFFFGAYIRPRKCVFFKF